MRLLRNAGVVSGLTLLSRLLGLVREMFVAAYLGAGPIADTFFQALTVPNTFRRILAEGAFNAAFVPLYAGELEKHGKAEADAFMREALSGLVAVTLIIVLIFQIAAPWLAYVFFPGAAGDPDLMALAALLLQLTMPYLLCMAVTALLSGALNAHGKFAAPTASQLLFSVVLIGILAADFAEGERLAFWLSVGVSASGLLQAGFLWMAAARGGLKPTLRLPRITPRIKRLIALGVPGAIAAGTVQINVLVTSSIATLEAGARSWLNYAERLYQLPLGVIGIAMGLALLPDLTRRLRAGDEAGGAFAMNRAIEVSLAFTLPAVAAFLLIPEFLVSGLLERGRFTTDDTAATALVLVIFALGLPSFILVKVLSPGYFAREDTRTPMRFSIAAVVLNFALAVTLFFGGMGYAGLAVATTAAGWLQAGLLALTLSRRGDLTLDARLMGRLPRIALAAAAMGAAVWILVRYETVWGEPVNALAGPLLGPVVGLVGVIALGAAVYALACLASGALKLSELRAALRPRRGAPPTHEEGP
jgi:putative peptidoglycan lipid II flippase